jgi:hypothetical protein
MKIRVYTLWECDCEIVSIISYIGLNDIKELFKEIKNHIKGKWDFIVSHD